MKFDVAKHTLKFKFDAGTSRGVLRTKDSWFIKLSDGDKHGIGECGVLEGLSMEDIEYIDLNIKDNLNVYISEKHGFRFDSLTDLPSIRFGLEMAERDFQRNGNGILFDNAFTRGEKGIPINGLVWMGAYEFMYEQIKAKIKDGFTCIKLKIGAIDFEKEIDLLKYIRSQFSAEDIEIRVDANGAFPHDTALDKLKILSSYDLHSIEQPIKQGQWEEMARLCEVTPLPVALDEELIGINVWDEKSRLLDAIDPQYIILKPSLVGGWKASEEWMNLADKREIGYWVTSALESNIGLNAIAQWTREIGLDMPQGLGTGQLYQNNFEGPLYIENGELKYNPDIPVYNNFDLFS